MGATALNLCPYALAYKRSVWPNVKGSEAPTCCFANNERTLVRGNDRAIWEVQRFSDDSCRAVRHHQYNLGLTVGLVCPEIEAHISNVRPPRLVNHHVVGEG